MVKGVRVVPFHSSTGGTNGVGGQRNRGRKGADREMEISEEGETQC